MLRVKRMRGNDELEWMEQAPSEAKADETSQVGLKLLNDGTPCLCYNSISDW